MIRRHRAPFLRLAFELTVLASAAFPLDAQTTTQSQSDCEVQQLKRMILDLESRVVLLELSVPATTHGSRVSGGVIRQ
jgi:hypothetical protein